MSSEDFTQKLPDSDRLDQLITLAQGIETLVGGIDVRLTSLEEKVDARLHDTRPIWESVRSDIAELRKGQEQLRSDMVIGLRKVERKIGLLNDDFLQMKTDQRMLEDRIEKLEPQTP